MIQTAGALNVRIYIMYISPQVVHRDLKLDNLLVDDKGRVIISDFGKAVVLDETMKVAYNHGELNTQHMYMVHGSTQQSNAVHVCNNSTCIIICLGPMNSAV